MSFTDIQQDFVRRYMDDNGVVGVRVREHQGKIVLYVEVEAGCSAKLPSTFRKVPVVVQQGQRAVLAYR
jgi:hypothetical protein